MSVRKGLAKGFSLETGLTYTLLSSDAKLAGEEQQIEQKLHYVGIPLRANWNFLDKKLVTLYVSGGGMVEKCVYGKLGSEKETSEAFAVLGIRWCRCADQCNETFGYLRGTGCCLLFQ